MDTFGKRLAYLRKEKKITQSELGKLLKTSFTVVGRYERDEMLPSIEVAKKLSIHLETTIGYLLGESDNADLFKDPVMLQRLTDLNKMDTTERSHILHVLDGFIVSTKLKNIATL